MKKIFIICLAVCAMFIFAGCADTLPAEEPENSGFEEIEYTEDYYDRKFMDGVLSEEEKRENIFSALTDIKMNTEFIKDFEKIEDGEEGEKYTFIYRETEFTVIMEDDSTVASVKVGEDGEDVYLKGYEPYDAEDYIMTEGMKNSFKHSMENAVEVALDDPEIYEYSDDWSFRHEGNFYYTSVTVFIGEDKTPHFMNLICYYDEPENSMYWYELTVDGKELSLPLDYEVIKKAERQPVSEE